ncbi:MAG: SIMPL domain-containing protein [Vicinamibacterales bacterium]
MRLLCILVATTVSIGSTASAFAGQAQAAGEPAQSIRVSGQATVEAQPDQADIDVGVVTRADTSQRAAADNARRLDAVLDQLRRTFGAAVTLRSVAYSVRPEYGRDTDGSDPKVTGYTATNVVRVTLSDLTKVGAVLDAATAAGANQVESIRFSLKQEDELRARALREAAISARSRADALASALGVRVVRVIFASEDGVAPTRRFAEVAAFAQRGAAASTPIETGPIEVSATVTLTVEVSSAARP